MFDEVLQCGTHSVHWWLVDVLVDLLVIWHHCSARQGVEELKCCDIDTFIPNPWILHPNGQDPLPANRARCQLRAQRSSIHCLIGRMHALWRLLSKRLFHVRSIAMLDHQKNKRLSSFRSLPSPHLAESAFSLLCRQSAASEHFHTSTPPTVSRCKRSPLRVVRLLCWTYPSPEEGHRTNATVFDPTAFASQSSQKARRRTRHDRNPRPLISASVQEPDAPVNAGRIAKAMDCSSKTIFKESLLVVGGWGNLSSFPIGLWTTGLLTVPWLGAARWSKMCRDPKGHGARGVVRWEVPARPLLAVSCHSPSRRPWHSACHITCAK